jgi:hypothetical protein
MLTHKIDCDMDDDCTCEPSIVQAIAHVQRMRNEAKATLDEYPEFDDADGWASFAGEDDSDVAYAVVQTFDSVLDVLTIIANGGMPEQGKP